MSLYIALFIYELTMVFSMANFVPDAERGKRRYVFLLVLPVFILIALRGSSIGSDTANYIRMYNIEAGGYTSDDVSRLEIGYRLMVKLLVFLGLSPQWLFVVSGFVFIFAWGWFVSRYSDNPGIVILLFLGFGLFSFELSGLRQSLAMSICLFAYPFIEGKKSIRFLLVVGIATAFHTSALVFIPAYFMAHQSLKPIWLMLEAVGIGIVLYFGTEIMIWASRFFDIGYGIEADPGGKIFVVVMAAITILSLVYRDQLLETKECNRIFINLNLISMVLWCMRLMSRTAERPSLFYMFATCVLVGNMVDIRVRRRELKTVFVLGLLFVAGVFFYRRVCQNTSIVPYRFFWQ